MPPKKPFPATDKDRILKSVLRGERTLAQVTEEHGIDGAELVSWLEALQAEKRRTFERYETLVGRYGALIEAVDGQIVTIPAGVATGMRWRIHRDYPAQFASGTWDLSFQETLRALLRPGDVFFDVGANAGFHALVASRLVGASGRVVCFEPVAANCLAIRDALTINALTNCELAEVAVSDADGPVAFYRHPNNGLGSTVNLSKVALEKIEVAGVRLDTFARSARTPHVIKIDVEGAEDRVLDGAETLLSGEEAPVLLLELHSPESGTNVVRTLARHGYVYAPISEEPGRASSGPELHLDQLSIANVAHLVALKARDARLAAFRQAFGAGLRWSAP